MIVGVCDIHGEAKAQARVSWPPWERDQAAEAVRCGGLLLFFFFLILWMSG